MIKYDKTKWVDGTTVLRASHMEKIEKGITDIIDYNNSIYTDEDTRKSNEKQRQEEHSRKMNEVSEAVSDIQKDYDSLQKIIIDENASANLQNQINKVSSQLEHKASKSELEVERKRIDLITKTESGSTDGNAELIDLRIGVDGKTYETAGSSIRSQFIDVLDNINMTELFSGNINSWGEHYTFTVGETSSVISNSYNKDGIHYRHDSIDLISVVPGTKLIVKQSPGNNCKVGIWEYDIDQKGVKDSGYINDEVKLSDNTHYIRLLLTTKDYSDVCIDDKLKSNNISIKGYSYNKHNIPSLNSENIAISNLNMFDYGTQYHISNNALTILNEYTRFRLKEEIYICTNKVKRLYYNIDSRCEMIILEYNEDTNIWSSTNTWIKGEGYIYLHNNTSKIIYNLRMLDGTRAEYDKLHNLKIILSDENISDRKSFYDYNLNYDYAQQLRYKEISSNSLSDSVRFISHATMASYVPENSLEGVRMSKILGMWGVETDLLLTKDNEIILMHDDTVDRTTNGTGYVSELTINDIKGLKLDYNLRGFSPKQIPTLDEFLDECKKNNIYPILEIKPNCDDKIVDILLEKLKNRNILTKCMIITFSYEFLKNIRSKNKFINISLILEQDELITEDIIDKVVELGNCGVDVYGSTNLTKDMIEECHKNNVNVIAWTIDDKNLCNYLIDIGVDMITTNKLADNNRNKVILNTSFTSSDKLETITIGNSASRNNFNIESLTFKDDWTAVLKLEEFLHCSVVNLQPSLYLRAIMSTNDIYDIKSSVSNGEISLKFFKNGEILSKEELPSWLNIELRIEF